MPRENIIPFVRAVIACPLVWVGGAIVCLAELISGQTYAYWRQF